MDLAARLADLLAASKPESRRMFGGTCFLVNGNMVIGTFKDGILARVGPAGREALGLPGARPFEMNGRAMTGYVMVAESALASDAALKKWVNICVTFNKTLPPKPVKKPKRTK